MDFFADSPATQEWGVLVSLLEEMDAGAMKLPPGAALSREPWEAAGKKERGWLRAVGFDFAAHTLLCNELKHL